MGLHGKSKKVGLPAYVERKRAERTTPLKSAVCCPECGDPRSTVIDSRSRPPHREVRRRRCCPNGHRYTTREVVDAPWAWSDWVI